MRIHLSDNLPGWELNVRELIGWDLILSVFNSCWNCAGWIWVGFDRVVFDRVGIDSG